MARITHGIKTVGFQGALVNYQPPKGGWLAARSVVKYHIMDTKQQMLTKIPEGFRASYLNAVWKGLEQVYLNWFPTTKPKIRR